MEAKERAEIMIKKIWIVFAVTCIVTIPVRLYQLMYYVDSQTGFFTDGNVTSTIVSVILIAGCAAVLFLSRRQKNFSLQFQDMSSMPSVIFCGLSGAVMLIYAVRQLALVASGDTSWEEDYMQQIPVWVQHPVLYAALAILAVAAAINLLVLAWGLGQGKSPYLHLPAATLFLPLWSCMDLTVMFVRSTEVVNSIESLYSMFMVIFLLVCLFAQARFLSGLDDSKSRLLMVASGMCCAIVTFTVTVPNLLMYAMGRGDICSMTMESSVLYLVLAMFLQSLSFKMIKKQKISEKI